MRHPLDRANFFHIGIGVPNLEEAAEQLTDLFGYSWTPVLDSPYRDFKSRLVISREGPPYYELIESSPGSPWSPAQGERPVHLAYWAEDLAGSQRYLLDRGYTLEVDGVSEGVPYCYLRAPGSGLMVEIVAADVPNPWNPDEPMRNSFGS